MLVRVAVLASFVATAFALPAAAQGLGGSPIKTPSGAMAGLGGSPIKSLLSRASDAALDKLSKPGAFSADGAIRIGLPGVGGLGGGGALGGLGKMAGGLGAGGLGGGLTDGLNAAAGQAATAAKPIFRSAIDRMSVQDMAGLAGQGGATQYLRKSAGADIAARLAPIVRAALGRTGALGQSSQLSAAGLNPDTLTDYVTRKTSDGIFTYIGREEASMRQNPAALGKLF